MSKYRYQYIAEFVGTFFLVFFACGAVSLTEVMPGKMEPFVIPLIFGGTVAIMIYATGHISGAHFNPAVTLAFWITRQFPTKKLFGYILSQTTGATVASLMHLLIWGRQHSFGVTSLAVAPEIGIIIEFVLSFALMFVIISVATDSRAVGELAGIAIGTTVMMCAFVGGPLTGASMNPARSIGPALVSGNFDHLWIYIIVPVLGTVVGGMVYEKIRCINTDESSEDHGCC